MKTLLKTIFSAVALASFAGALFIFAGFATRLPDGVFINGVDVGAMRPTQAVAALRAAVESGLETKHLHICADERIFSYSFPEIDYRDNFQSAVKNIRKRGNYFVPVHYFLNGAEDIADGICGLLYRAPRDAEAVFNREGEPFDYIEGEDGAECDRQKLLDDVSASLNGDFAPVKAEVKKLDDRLTVPQLRLRTAKLYSFTTFFDGQSADRAHNIRLAADKINGTAVPAGETFSFNRAVGPRTEEAGFKSAKIIEKGKFVDGTGGGVCQVSTTLYNAALLSGLEIEEYHPHSLRVGYVPPSRDAMVSGSACDLKFKNNRLTPIYVRMNCTLSSVTATIYGESDGWEYTCVSEVTATIEKPPATFVTGDEDKTLSLGREGTVSSARLIKRRVGEELAINLRKDVYAAVGDVVMRRVDPLPQQEDCDVGRGPAGAVLRARAK